MKAELAPSQLLCDTPFGEELQRNLERLRRARERRFPLLMIGTPLAFIIYPVLALFGYAPLHAGLLTVDVALFSALYISTLEIAMGRVGRRVGDLFVIDAAKGIRSIWEDEDQGENRSPSLPGPP